MRLILIYGPPGVGKLTVAKKLAKLTDYKIFHNQLTVDLVCSLFDFEDKRANSLNSKFRLELIEAAAKAKIKGVIMTICFAKGTDDVYFDKLAKRVRKHGGKISYVQLLCANKELHKRVKNKSRKKHKKITSSIKLSQIMKKYELEAKLPKVKTITIDNTNKKPDQVAKLIKKKLKI